MTFVSQVLPGLQADLPITHQDCTHLCMTLDYGEQHLMDGFKGCMVVLYGQVLQRDKLCGSQSKSDMMWVVQQSFPLTE